MHRIRCGNCQFMLEIREVNPGDVFVCPLCDAQIEGVHEFIAEKEALAAAQPEELPAPPLPLSSFVPEPPPRLYGVLTLLAGVALLGLNHMFAVHASEIYLVLVIAGPLLTMLGLGACVDPRLLVAFKPAGQMYPVGVRIMAGLLMVVGLFWSALIWFVFYQVRP